MPDQERQIVVHRDNRTFEQQHRDRLSSLEKEHHGQQLARIEPRFGRDLFPRGWFDDVDRWMSESHRAWMEDIRRMRENMFSLVPFEDFDRRPFGNVNSIIERMERQMEAVRRNMYELMQREMKPFLQFPKFNEGVLDFLKDAYEVGPDGKLHFMLRFDLNGFNPEDIDVTTGKNWVTVKARKSMKTPQRSESREYYRSVYLPDSVVDTQFKCHLSKDGILTLDAPVKETDYNRLTFDRQKRLAIKPSEEQSLQRTRQDAKFSDVTAMEIPYQGKSGLIVMNDPRGGKKIHVEVPLEAGFGANDMRAYVEAKELVVHGRKPVSEGYWREFTRTYKLPHTIDALSIRSRVHNNVMLIEAPLLRGP